MKRKIMLFCMILSVAFLLGCQNRPDNTSSITEENTETSQETENYEKYSLQDSENSEFNKMIAENGIDKEYLKEIQNTKSTLEMIEVESKYINLWKEEMNKNLDHLLGKLSAEDASALSAAQADWEKYVYSEAAADRAILTNDEGVNFFGSSFKYTSRSNIRKMYRERAIHLRYLCYLIDAGY